jgi:hypothetical protein
VRAKSAANCSISSVSRYVISEIVLFCSAVHVFFVFASIEEGRNVVLAERVIWVHKALRVSNLRGLDIPESMVWNGVKNLINCGLLKAVRESFLHILDKIVFLTILEN